MDMRFGTWNIRSFYRIGSLTTVVRELGKYRLDLVGVQEVRWEKGGTERAEDCTFFCGQGNGDYQLGTGFFIRKRIVSAVRRVEFISDRMSYIILRGRWCSIIVLNVHASCEGKGDEVKDRFYDEQGRVFDQFSRYDMNILLGDFNAKIGRENIFKPTIGNKSLHEISNDSGLRVVNFATSKNLVIKSTMFPHRYIHKYIWTCPKGNTHNQIDHVLIDRRRHSSLLDVRSFRGADCDTDHYLVVAKVRVRLAVSKRAAQKIDTERFNVKNLNEGDVKEQYQVTIRNKFAALENLKRTVGTSTGYEAI
jgi:exonuclease III